MSQSQNYPQVIDAPREDTMSLLAKVLGITSIGFLVTALGVYTAPPWSAIPGIVTVFILIFVIPYVRARNPTIALGLFYLLTFFMGWNLGPMIHNYIAAMGTGIVIQAAATTGLGMAAMGIVAYLFNINYRRLAGIGTGALLVLILVGIVNMFVHFLHPGVYAWLTLVIFTALTIADFARVRAGGDGQPAVSLALSIYLDAINIFTAVLSLFGGRSRD